MNLQVELLEEDNIQCFKVIGEIDVFTAPILKERLTPMQKVKGLQAVIDLADVDYIDSTGLGVFVGFYKALKENEGHVKIVGVNARLKRLFKITGLDQIMDIETEVGEDGDATL